MRTKWVREHDPLAELKTLYAEKAFLAGKEGDTEEGKAQVQSWIREIDAEICSNLTRTGACVSSKRGETA